MRLTVIVIGFALVVFGSSILGRLRIRHLQMTPSGVFALPTALIFAIGLLWNGASAVRAEVTTNINDSQLFQFKFPLNKPLVYAIQVTAGTVNHSSAGSRHWLEQDSESSHYKVRLTGVKINPDGTTRVHFETFDREYDADSINPSGHTVLSYRGLEIVRKQNGVVTIDTAKGIGISRAYLIKLSVYPTLLSGYMDFAATGKVKRLDGDLPFIDYWTRTLKSLVDYFHISFPDRPITTDGADNFWSVRYSEDSEDAASFFGSMAHTNTFRRESNVSIDGNTVAMITMSGSKHENDVGPFPDPLSNGKSHIRWFDYAFTNSGTFHFDQAHGVLIDEMIRDRCILTQTVSQQQEITVTNHLDMNMDIQMTLISKPQ